MPREDHDQITCKNASRERAGVYNALRSHRPFDHCLLYLPFGSPFDTQLPTQTGTKGKDEEVGVQRGEAKAESARSRQGRGGGCAAETMKGALRQWAHYGQRSWMAYTPKGPKRNAVFQMLQVNRGIPVGSLYSVRQI